ncbi:MAG: AzlD domain-containing protein, partial [Acidimicrobiales bacterium]
AADGTSLVLDARLAGVGLAAVAVWRRAPFVVVVLVAMAATALIRLLS